MEGGREILSSLWGLMVYNSLNIYCCLTNWPKFRALKHQSLYYAHDLWVGNLCPNWLGDSSVHMRWREVTHCYLGGSWAELEVLRELHSHIWFLSRGEQKAGLSWAALSLQGLFMWSLQQGGQPACKWPQSSKGGVFQETRSRGCCWVHKLSESLLP